MGFLDVKFVICAVLVSYNCSSKILESSFMFYQFIGAPYQQQLFHNLFREVLIEHMFSRCRSGHSVLCSILAVHFIIGYKNISASYSTACGARTPLHADLRKMKKNLWVFIHQNNCCCKVLQ